MARARALAGRAKSVRGGRRAAGVVHAGREGRRAVRGRPGPLPGVRLVRTATKLNGHLSGSAPYVASLRALGRYPQRDAAVVRGAQRRVLLVWLLRADGVLRRRGGDGRGAAVMVAAMALGAGVGVLLHALGDLPGSALDCALVGIPPARRPDVRLAAVQVQTVREGEGLARAAAHLAGRPDPRGVRGRRRLLVLPAEDPTRRPGGRCVSSSSAFTICGSRRSPAIQGGINELAIGNEGEARRMAERGLGDGIEAAVAAVAAPVGDSG